MLICNHFYGFRFKCIHVKCHLTYEKLLSFWNEIPFIAWKYMRHLKHAKAWIYVVNNEVNFSFDCDLKYLIDKASFGKKSVVQSKHVTWNKTLSIIVTTTVYHIKSYKTQQCLEVILHRHQQANVLHMSFSKFRKASGRLWGNLRGHKPQEDGMSDYEIEHNRFVLMMSTAMK